MFGRRPITFHALVLLVAGAMIPAQAFATTAAAVAVPVGSGLQRETATIAYALESVVRQSNRVEYVDLAWRSMGAAAEEMDEAAKRGRALLARGTEAYQNFEFTAALHAFEDAIAAFEESDLTQHFPALLEAHAMNAATAYFNGDVDGARRAIRQLLGLRPDFVFDGRIFPPDIRDVAEQMRSEIEQEARNPLEVNTTPIPARIYVNGVFRGISPIEVRNLDESQHYVTAVALGHGLVQERHRAGPGAIVRLGMRPAADGAKATELLKTLERRLASGSVSAPGAELAQWAGVDEILVAGVDNAGGGRLKVVAARVAADGHVLATGEHDLALDEPAGLSELATFAAGLYREDLPRGPNGEPIRLELRVAPRLDRTTVGFIVGGAGVAAALGGVVMGLQARSASLDAKTIPQVRQEEITEAYAGARRSAFIADGLYVTAVIGAGVGLYLAMPALRPEPAEPAGGLREDWFAWSPGLSPAPQADGAVLTIGGRFR
jgi:hypothetical protein